MEYQIRRTETQVVAIQASSEDEALELLQQRSNNYIVISRDIVGIEDTIVGVTDFTAEEWSEQVNQRIAQESELIEAGDDWALTALREMPVFSTKRETK